MNEHVESLNQVKATIVDLAIKFGPKGFVAIVIPFPAAGSADAGKRVVRLDKHSPRRTQSGARTRYRRSRPIAGSAPKRCLPPRMAAPTPCRQRRRKGNNKGNT